MSKVKRTVRDILKLAEIELNGDRPCDLIVKDDRFYSAILSGGALALGETYMDGWWDCECIDQLVCMALRADLEHRIKPLKVLLPVMISKLANRQTRARAFRIGEHHYDLGNELYKRMLDKRMIYTCGYWKRAADLNQAQEDKLDLVCKKMQLQPGMKLLDIGCGWGGFAKFAAEKYRVEVVGVTVSGEQIELGSKMCEGLPVDLRLQDYRDVQTCGFDRVVSLGMFEHVGVKNYRTFMQVVDRCLHKDGLFLLHTIGANTAKESIDPWTDKYIFPGGMLPTQRQITHATEGVFVMEDWHNFGVDYDPTLTAWMENVDRHWPELAGLGYDQRFYRMWRYFLLSSAGSFRARRSQLWQVVYSKKGIGGGYQAVR